jgi:hypothetical protein
MAALHRAIALAEVDQVAVAVAEQLHFDVPRFDQRLLEDQFVAAKPFRASERAVRSCAGNSSRCAPGACRVRRRRRWP